MKNQYIDKAKDYFKKNLSHAFKTPKGCRNSEISKLEKYFGYKLPMAYIEFLLWMGRDFEGPLGGSDWFLKHVRENTEELPFLLKENNIPFALSKDFCAFFFHQGYMAAWFDLPVKSEDPLVYFFSEGQNMNQPEEKGKFSEFLLSDLKGVGTIISNFRNE